MGSDCHELFLGSRHRRADSRVRRGFCGRPPAHPARRDAEGRHRGEQRRYVRSRPFQYRTDRAALQRRMVRRVVDEVCKDLPGVAHVEIDMDANPEAARRLSVMSLPTTVIFDADGRPRYRTTGVPKAADLRSALAPLLA